MIRLLENSKPSKQTRTAKPGKRREVDANLAAHLLIRGDISPAVHLRDE
jgi:hypothetical protein